MCSYPEYPSLLSAAVWIALAAVVTLSFSYLLISMFRNKRRPPPKYAYIWTFLIFFLSIISFLGFSVQWWTTWATRRSASLALASCTTLPAFYRRWSPPKWCSATSRPSTRWRRCRRPTTTSSIANLNDFIHFLFIWNKNFVNWSHNSFFKLILLSNKKRAARCNTKINVYN